MCLSLLTDPNQNYIICIACAESNICKVLERSLYNKAWYSGEGCLFPSNVPFIIIRYKTKIILIEALAQWVIGDMFSKVLYITRRDTADKVLYSSNNVISLLNYHNQDHTICSACKKLKALMY
jgi:hypothetical protein